MATIKKLIIHLLYSITVILPQAVYATDPDVSGLIEKRRNIVKIFDVKDQDLLAVDNQFGQVKVNLWSKNEIKVEIVITANAPTDGRASEYLSAVVIDERREKNRINLTTVINRSQFGQNSWSNKRGEKNFIQIDNTVFMPKQNAMIVKNKLGNTDIQSFSAPLTINTAHGAFSAAFLSNAENTIDVSYGSAVIGKMDGGKL